MQFRSILIVFAVLIFIMYLTPERTLQTVQIFSLYGVFLMSSFSSLEQCTASVQDKENKFRVIYNIMGLQQLPYVFSMICFYFLKVFVTLSLMLLILFLSINKKKEQEFDSAWLGSTFTTLIFQSLIMSTLNHFLCFNIKKVQTIQNIFQFFQLALYFIFLFSIKLQNTSFLGFLVPYYSFFKFQYTWLIESQSATTGECGFIVLQQFVCTTIWLTITILLDQSYPLDDSNYKNPFSGMKKAPAKPKSDLENNLLEKEDGLILQNLGKQFGEFKVLQNVNMRIQKGEVVSLLGHNGAGKSTLINIITGIYEPTQGEIFYNNESFKYLQENNLFKIGICPSFEILFEEMTVYDHLKMIGYLRNVENIEESIQEAMEVLKLTEFAKFKVNKLSGGYKRRLTIAISLFGNPDCLFLDEPTSSIDPQSRQEIWRLLEQIKRKRSNTITFLTTHHLEEAEQLADSVKVLVRGQVYAEGTIQSLKTTYGVGYDLSFFFEKHDSNNLTSFQVTQSMLELSFADLQYQFDSRKMVIKIPDHLNSSITEIIQIVQQNQANGVIDLNSNSLEDVYLKIQQQANRSDFSQDNNKIEILLEKLFRNQLENTPGSLKVFFIMTKQNFFYLLGNKIQLVSLIVFMLYSTFAVLIVKNYFGNSSFFKTAGTYYQIQKYFIFTETFVLLKIPYQLIVERVNNVRQFLLANNVGFFSYYFSLFALNILIQLVFLLLVFLNFQFAINENFWVNFTFCSFLFLRKIHYICILFYFQNLFEHPKNIRYFLFPYIFINLLIYWIGAYYKFDAVLFILDILSLVNFDSENGPSGKGFALQIFTQLLQIAFWVLINYFREVRINNFNYVDKSYSKSERKEPINDHEVTINNEYVVTQVNQDRFFRTIELNKSYKDKKVVNKVNFGIDEKLNIGLLGPNGAGKSTVINMIINKVRKDSGILSFKSHKTSSSKLAMNQQSQYVFNNLKFGIVNQSNTIWDSLKTKQIIGIFRDLNGIDQSSLDVLIKYFEFDGNMQKNVEELSSGNQRKLCILISLISNPQVFVYDEATCGVDLMIRMKLQNIFNYFKKNRNSIGLLTTHFLKDIELFCDKLMIINGGELKYINYIDSMKTNIGGYIVALFYDKREDADNKLLLELNAFADGLKEFCEVQKVSHQQKEFQDDQMLIFIKKIQQLDKLMGKLIDGNSQQIFKDFSIRQKSIEDIYIEILNN